MIALRTSITWNCSKLLLILLSNIHLYISTHPNSQKALLRLSCLKVAGWLIAVQRVFLTLPPTLISNTPVSQRSPNKPFLWHFSLGQLSANHPGTVPLEQARLDPKVAFKESRVTKIDRLLPVGTMNLHSTFQAKPAIAFGDAVRSHTSTQTTGQLKAIT